VGANLSLANRLTLRQLRAVIAVGEAESLVGAAAKLNLTQSAVTKALKEAEAAAGVTLFERSNRGVAATAYGDALLRHAKLVMAQLAHASGELADLKDGTGGRVIVGTLLVASARILPDAIMLLHRERPKLTVVVVEGTNDLLMPALRVGEIDLVVGRLPEFRQREGVVQEALLHDGASVVVRTGHPLARRRNLKLADLAKFPWILPRMETTLRRQIDKDFRDAGLEPPAHAIESVSLLTNRRLLLDGDYVSVWPRQVAREDHEQRRIVLLPLKLPSTIGPIGITTRAHARLSPAAQALIQAIRDVAKHSRNTVG
jgi:DNA-binding transcriptional LysR family regulator